MAEHGRGPQGVQGVQGIQGVEGEGKGEKGERGPRSRNLANRVGYAILVLGMIVTVWIVVEHAKDQDIALCRGQRANSQSLIELLEAAKDRLRATPVEARPATYEESLDFYEDEIAKRKGPLPCERELGLAGE